MPRSHFRRAAVFRTYAGLLLLTACVYALMYGPQPMFNAISRDFDVDGGMIGLVVGVFMLSLCVSPLCIGMVLGKIGIRRAVLLSSLLLGVSGMGVYLAPTYPVFLAVRTAQALLAPVLLTSVMAGIAAMFRHLDLNRALAGYVASNLVGSLFGRLAGGMCAELLGWRIALTGICCLFFLCLPALRRMPDVGTAQARMHSPGEYREVFRQKGIPSLLFVEACGIFVFAAIGNLIPLRMAELGQGNSEGLIAVMYLGYSVGLAASACLRPLTRLFGTEGRLLVFGSGLFVTSMLTLAAPSLWSLFAGLWLIALGEFIVHALCPGIINRIAVRSGRCDRSMVNGLFLSCYYFGGVLGSWVPGLCYASLDWFACYLCMQIAQVCAFVTILRLRRDMPELE